jgi:hypothetical protein
VGNIGVFDDTRGRMNKSQVVVETPRGWMVNCRNCQWHEFPKESRHGKWTFNGNVFSPTFVPSMNELLNPPDSKDYRPDIASRRCHFIITDGRIHYCGDCTHDLRGTTEDMIPFDDVKVRFYDLLMAEHRAKQGAQ